MGSAGVERTRIALNSNAVDAIEGTGTPSWPVDDRTQACSEGGFTRTEHPQIHVRLADTVAAAVGVTFAIVAQQSLRPVSATAMRVEISLSIVMIATLIVALTAVRGYVARAIDRPTEELMRIGLATVIAIASAVMAVFAIHYDQLSRLWVGLVAIGISASLALERTITRCRFQRLRASGELSRRVAIVGCDHEAAILGATLRADPHFGYTVVGFIGDGIAEPSIAREVLAPTANAEKVLAELGCIGVIISPASFSVEQLNSLVRRLTSAQYHVAVMAGLRDVDTARLRWQVIDGYALAYVEPVVHDGWHALAKRLFDLMVSIAAVVFTAPILLFAAMAIKLESPGPILFRQERVGRDGRLFQIYKLRTMSVDAEERKAELMAMNESDGALFKIRNDPRITRVGRVLRSLSIDEIPQFFNVLRGEMSVVGPRPALPEEVSQWDPDLHERLRVLPGITGMWQVRGRSDASFEAYRRLDLYYVRNWSLRHDLAIMFLTIRAVLGRRGAV